MKTVGRLLICAATLCAGCKLINYIGAIYAENISGYRRGNRYRLASIVWLEWIMLHADLLIYAHLFSYFHPPTATSEVDALGSAAYKALDSHQRGLSVVWRTGNGGANKAVRARMRLRFFGLYIAVVLLAHVTYLFYLFYDFTIPWPVVEVAGWCNGIWLHLFAFSFLFVSVNSLMNWLCRCAGEWGRLLAERIQRLPLIGRFFGDNRFQVRVTLLATTILCLVQWLAAGRLAVKEMELQLGANWANRHALPVDRGELRVALLSDLHGGASVYRDEIAAVVDRTNALEADVVLIVGDAIDAPVALIGERMKPLRHLRARLGVFFTTGNHDYYYGNVQEWIALFKSFGIRTLVNEKVEIGLGDGGSTAKVCLVGLNDASAWKSGIHRSDSSSIGKCPLSEPIVVLAHNPAAADRIVADARAFNRTVDLILSGHTHAGQYYVIVPFVYWLLPYFYGPYELLGGRGGGETTKLLVSAGTLYQGSPMKMPFMSEIWLLRLRWPSS